MDDLTDFAAEAAVLCEALPIPADADPCDAEAICEEDMEPMPQVQELPGETDAHGCRFIAGEPRPIWHGMFCRAAVAEPPGSWCAAHRALVWRRVPRKPRRGGAVLATWPKRRAARACRLGSLVGELVWQPAGRGHQK